MKTINEIIVKEALSNIDKEEIRGNLGFKDKELERKMKAVGFQSGQAWCSYAAELIWKLAYQKYDSTWNSTLDRLFSASAVNTYNNFKSDINFIESKIPEIGALVVWRNYKKGVKHWTGHIGIVIAIKNKKEFYTIEGNTNDTGGREGYKFAKKRRALSYIKKDNGLNLMGFIIPKS